MKKNELMMFKLCLEQELLNHTGKSTKDLSSEMSENHKVQIAEIQRLLQSSEKVHQKASTKLHEDFKEYTDSKYEVTQNLWLTIKSKVEELMEAHPGIQYMVASANEQSKELLENISSEIQEFHGEFKMSRGETTEQVRNDVTPVIRKTPANVDSQAPRSTAPGNTKRVRIIKRSCAKSTPRPENPTLIKSSERAKAGSAIEKSHNQRKESSLQRTLSRRLKATSQTKEKVNDDGGGLFSMLEEH